MESFGTTLGDCIKEQGYTVYELSKQVDLSRSMLQAAITGRKKLAVASFRQVCNTAFFTSTQLKRLCKAYYSEKYGPGTLKTFDYIESMLSGNLRKELKKDVKYSFIEPELNKYYNNMEEILSLIYTILNDSETSSITSNFPFSQDEVNHVVYSFLLDNYKKAEKANADAANIQIATDTGNSTSANAGSINLGKSINFSHYISKSNPDYYNYNEIFFNSVFYAELGYMTYIYNESAATSLNCFMPYFILTDKYILQYDENIQNALLLDSEKIGDYYKQKLDGIKSECYTDIFLPSTPFEIMSNLITNDINGVISIGFENMICAQYLTTEMINEIATPAIKSIPGIGQMLMNHYKYYIEENNHKYTQILTYEALINFAERGYIDSYPRNYAKPMPKEMRIEYLRKFYNDKQVNDFRITMPGEFSSDYCFGLNIVEHYHTVILFTTYDIEKPGAFHGNVIARSDNRILYNDITNFMDYFLSSPKVYDSATSKVLLKNIIDRLEVDGGFEFTPPRTQNITSDL